MSLRRFRCIRHWNGTTEGAAPSANLGGTRETGQDLRAETSLDLPTLLRQHLLNSLLLPHIRRRRPAFGCAACRSGSRQSRLPSAVIDRQSTPAITRSCIGPQTSCGAPRRQTSKSGVSHLASQTLTVAECCAKKPNIYRRCQRADFLASTPRATRSRNSSSAAIQVRSR